MLMNLMILYTFLVSPQNIENSLLINLMRIVQEIDEWLISVFLRISPFDVATGGEKAECGMRTRKSENACYNVGKY